jgi:hypothetical protein
MEVGRFYLERRNFPAAINRFRDVVAKYQTTRHAWSRVIWILAFASAAYSEVGYFWTSSCREASAFSENFPAAINRFRDVVAKYQTTRHAEEALERLTEAYCLAGELVAGDLDLGLRIRGVFRGRILLDQLLQRGEQQGCRLRAVPDGDVEL